MEYERITQGIRVKVRSRFSLAQSDPAEGRFVFMYHVLMENEGAVPAKLLFRHWRIHEAGGVDSEVDGEGVVGEQPLLMPGTKHEYQSFCILRSPVGFMEGYYTFAYDDGEEFQVEVPRFPLSAPWPAASDDGGVMN
ncbi:MAG: Co2+/Mg2+ efflux protein ApaG [Gemmatimonadetes bacterium]|nr:Co2+/Mg2+ efflux protein ApaG [Gemmatimonadota bacterium]